jgi:hypothetical protein
MQRSLFLSLCCALALVAAACGGDDPVGPGPTPISPVSEPITGELPPFSVRIHPFSVQNPGAVTITLSEITPNDLENPTRIGLDLGTAVNQTTCQVVVSNNSVTQAGSVTGTATSAGTLCVRVYPPPDGLPGPVTYRLAVTHF